MNGKEITRLKGEFINILTNTLNKKFERGEIYNLPILPHELKADMSSLTLEELRKRWLMEFYRIKFKFLLLRLGLKEGDKTAQSRLDKLKNELKRECPQWEKCIEFLESSSEHEEWAYISRVAERCKIIEDGECQKWESSEECSNCDSLEMVHFRWYPDVKEFKEWASACRKKLHTRYKKLKNEFESAHNHGNFLCGLDKRSIYDDVSFMFIQSQIFHSFHKSPLEAPNEVLKKWMLEFLQTELEFEKILADIISKLTNKLKQRESKDALINEFLLTLQNSNLFKCELCDFLEVRRLGDKDVVTFFHTTKQIDRTLNKEERQKIKESESYGIGEGITGGIFVSPKDMTMFHVGTNYLDRDYRKCADKEDYYEKIYGIDIKNFWTFPIRKNGDLIYAFRVVNKLDPDGKSVAEGWPPFTRLRLCRIGKLIGELLLLTEMDPNTRLTEQIKNLFDLDWIQIAELKELVERLKEIAFCRIENDELGCTILVVPEKNKNELEGFEGLKVTLPYFNLADESFLKFCNKHAPSTYCAILNEKMELIECRKGIIDDGILNILKSYTRGNISIAFMLLKGEKVINIINDGEVKGEIYLSEKSGTWKIRIYSNIIDEIAKNIKKFKDIKEKLELPLLLACKLSLRRKGAIIVFGEKEHINDVLGKLDAHHEHYDDCYSREALDRFLKNIPVDPTILMRSDGKCIVTQKHYYSKTSKEEVSKNLSKEISSYLVEHSRHYAGFLLNYDFPDTLVFVASQNREITIIGDKTRFHLLNL